LTKPFVFFSIFLYFSLFVPMKYLLLMIFSLQAMQASAQSSCSSDQATAVKLISERFTNADCEICWTKPLGSNPNPSKSTVNLDWIAPSPAGDDAPLSAAANRDALSRLENLNIALPKEQQIVKTSVASTAYKLRVAHGLAVSGYIGSSIELTRFPKNFSNSKNLTAILLLTETIPKGTSDSPAERTLVRNMLIEPWVVTHQTDKKIGKQVVITRRPLSIPPGVNPDNLRVFGWVQDETGRVLAAAQSQCIESK
jgi:hypothetical protein